MPGILARLIRRVRALVRDTFGPIEIRPRIRPFDPAVGPQARSYLETLGDHLDTDAWSHVSRIGVCEAGLREALQALRAPSLGTGRAARDAELLRRDIDVLLSEPRGAVAVTLRRYPAANRAVAASYVERLEESARALTIIAAEILAARDSATSVGARIREVRQAFEARLPDTCAAVSLDQLESRLADATSTEQVQRIRHAINECAGLLEQRAGALEVQVTELSQLLSDMGRPAAVTPVHSLEQHVALLRDAAQAAAADTAVVARERVGHAAAAHAIHMDHEGGAPCFTRPAHGHTTSAQRAQRLPTQSELPVEWRSLHQFVAVNALSMPARADVGGSANGAQSGADAEGGARSPGGKRRIRPEVLDAMRLRRQQSSEVVPGRRPAGGRPGDSKGGHTGGK